MLVLSCCCNPSTRLLMIYKCSKNKNLLIFAHLSWWEVTLLTLPVREVSLLMQPAVLNTNQIIKLVTTFFMVFTVCFWGFFGSMLVDYNFYESLKEICNSKSKIINLDVNLKGLRNMCQCFFFLRIM